MAYEASHDLSVNASDEVNPLYSLPLLRREAACVVSRGREPAVHEAPPLDEALQGRQRNGVSSFTCLNYHLVFSTKHR